MPARRPYPIEYAAIVVATALAGMMILPIFARSRPSDGSYSRCPSNLMQISMALRLYAADCADFLPSVQGKGANFGWADALAPYTKVAFQCPGETHPAQNDPTQSGFTDYWMNARLGGHIFAATTSPTQTFLVGDGNDDTADARYALASFPAAWKTSAGTPLTRHLGRANYVFADGHFDSLSVLQAINTARSHF